MIKSLYIRAVQIFGVRYNGDHYELGRMLSYMINGRIHGTTFQSEIESLIEVNTGVKRDVIDFGRYATPLRYYSQDVKHTWITAHQKTIEGLCEQMRGVGRIMGRRYIEKSLFHNLSRVKSDIVLILDCNDYTRINEVILRGGIVLDIIPKGEKPFESSWDNLLKVVLNYNGSKKDLERCCFEYFTQLKLADTSFTRQRSYIG